MTLNDLLLRIRALVLLRRTESELQEELASHLEFQIRKYVASGLTVNEAARRARLDFGAPESVREECREARGIVPIAYVLQDLHYAVRSLRRSSGFSCFVVLILALGMGATLSIFSVADAILLRTLPVKDPGSLFRTVNASESAYAAGGGSSYPLFLQMQKRIGRLADLLAYQAADSVSVSIGQAARQHLMQQTVSGNYFEVLGVQAALGRLISAQDDRQPGRHPVAVISYRLWKTKLNGSTTAIGTRLSFNNNIYDIIGVTPSGFFGVEVGRIVDIWTPVSMAPAATLEDDHNFWLRIMGRQRPGVTMAQAAAPIQAVINEFMLEDVRLHAPPGTPKDIIARFMAGTRVKAVPAGGGISFLRGQYQQPLQILMLVAGLVMLIACSNVASILIAHGSTRGPEMAIRLSLGAGKFRILQQLLTESFLLVSLSAAAGLTVAQAATPLLVGLLRPSSDPASLVTTIDLRLLAFTCMLAAVTVILCGLLPALRLAKADIHTTLKNGLGLTSRGHARARKILLIVQIALSLVLVVAAGLFSRTLVNLFATSLGFSPSHVLVARMTLQNVRDDKFPLQRWVSLLQTVRSFPGLEQVSLSSQALFANEPQFQGVRTTASAIQPADPLTGLSFVSTDYFSTLGIGLTAGRDFSLSDEAAIAPSVAIVNQAFAHKFFGGQSPLGRKLTKLANEPVWTDIVGVAKDVKVSSLRNAAPPMVYVPYSQMASWLPPQAHPGLAMFLQVRAHRDLLSLSTELNQKLSSSFVIDGTYRQQELISNTLVREKLLANIADLFGALAVLLAGAGLYGIMSYAVIQRRREFGVRTALGAEPFVIMALVLRESAMVALAGIILGLVASHFASHWTASLLYGLAPDDIGTGAASAFLLLASLLSAAFIPACQAASANPMIALRNE